MFAFILQNLHINKILFLFQFGVFRGVGFAITNVKVFNSWSSCTHRKVNLISNRPNFDGTNFSHSTSARKKCRKRQIGSPKRFKSNRTRANITELHSVDTCFWARHCLCNQYWIIKNFEMRIDVLIRPE